MQDFELESLTSGGEHSQKVKAPPFVSDYSSKDCVNLPSSTVVSRFKFPHLNRSFLRMNMLLSLLFLTFFSPSIADEVSEAFSSNSKKAEKLIIVVIPSYNNRDWYEVNLQSVLQQNYTNFRIVYLDDASKDGTGDLVENYLQTHQIHYNTLESHLFLSQSIEEAQENTQLFKSVADGSNFFLLVKNFYRCGAMENLYRAINISEDESIIVTVDGDDWLAHPDVLSELNDLYSGQEVWYTHGIMSEYPSNSSWRSRPISPDVILNRTFRQSYCPSHLRTFYTWIFKKIKLEDLLYNGGFFVMTWDKAIMFPIAEMAGSRHAYVSKVSYIYNTANQINDDKVNAGFQVHLDQYIRRKTPYPLLESAPAF